jgi:predicted nucleotidyltransferase
MERELTEIIGRKVDLRTPQELSKYFRAEVISKAEVQYAEG